jgi:hypothetical protein
MSETELALAALLEKINFRLDMILEQAGRDLERDGEIDGAKDKEK